MGRNYSTPNQNSADRPCSCSAPSSSVDGVGGFSLDFLGGAAQTVLTFGADVVTAGAEAVADAGQAACNLLPPQVRAAMDITQQQPWHGLATTASLTLPNLMVHALPPVSYFAGILVLPGVLLLNTARWGFNFTMNCYDVNETLRKEACTIEEARKLLAGPLGGAMKLALRMGGQEQMIPLLDSVVDLGDEITGRVCRGQPPSLDAARELAIEVATRFAPELQEFLEHWDDLDELLGFDVGQFLIDELGDQGVPFTSTLSITGVLGPQLGAPLVAPTPSTSSGPAIPIALALALLS